MTEHYGLLRKMLGDLYEKRESLDDWTRNFVSDVRWRPRFSPAQKRAIKSNWFKYASDEEKYQLAIKNGLTQTDPEPAKKKRERGEASEPDGPIKSEPDGPIKRESKTTTKTTQCVAVSELVKRYGRPDFTKRGNQR